jgi:hypothetical protein
MRGTLHDAENVAYFNDLHDAIDEKTMEISSAACRTDDWESNPLPEGHPS